MRQGNVFTLVCHSVHRGEGSAQLPPPLDAEPPRVGQTPLDADPLGLGRSPSLDADPTPKVGQTPLPDTVNKRAVRILLECILVKVKRLSVTLLSVLIVYFVREIQIELSEIAILRFLLQSVFIILQCVQLCLARMTALKTNMLAFAQYERALTVLVQLRHTASLSNLRLKRHHVWCS